MLANANQATSSGAIPAKCITTWNGFLHGQESVFCPWEAEKPEDIKTSLDNVLNYVTPEAKQVYEVVWAALASQVHPS